MPGPGPARPPDPPGTTLGTDPAGVIPGRPLRIALVTYSTRPRGGVVHTLALAEALAALGQEVTVWSVSRHGDTGFFRPVDPAVRVRIVPLAEIDGEPFGLRVLRSIDRLGAALAGQRHRYDVVHAQDCISANAAGAGCLRTVHHLDTFTTPELVACHEKALRTPYGHLCVSAAVAAELRDGWGIEATVIPNGVSERFAAVPAAATAIWRTRLGRYVLAVGGIEPRKGTLDLVEAAARFPPGLRLVIAGGETIFDHRPYRDRVLERAAELGVEPVLLGPVPDDTLPALVAGADAFAFPSTKEGFGLAAMEALAAGVPVVARDLPVLREVFGDAVTFATDPAGFAAALAAPDRTKAQAGRELAGRHRWPEAARAHLAAYAKLVPGLAA
jgi:glycosyltransferase-like protein